MFCSLWWDVKYDHTQVQVSICIILAGLGNQTRFALCEEEHCNPESRPELSRACSSEKQCDGQWFAGSWGECSDSCTGPAKQKREVLCIAKIRGVPHVTNDIVCPVATKPYEEQSCFGNTLLGLCNWAENIDVTILQESAHLNGLRVIGVNAKEIVPLEFNVGKFDVWTWTNDRPTRVQKTKFLQASARAFANLHIGRIAIASLYIYPMMSRWIVSSNWEIFALLFDAHCCIHYDNFLKELQIWYTKIVQKNIPSEKSSQVNVIQCFKVPILHQSELFVDFMTNTFFVIESTCF